MWWLHLGRNHRTPAFSTFFYDRFSSRDILHLVVVPLIEDAARPGRVPAIIRVHAADVDFKRLDRLYQPLDSPAVATSTVRVAAATNDE